MSDSALSAPARTAALAQMRKRTFDLLVVGGGITGCGVALDAAARGLSVALVERRDVAHGTSSRSSKLIHGGLRYLELLDFGLVREGLRERRLLLTTLAPHLVRPVPFLFPLTRRGWERPYMAAGLLLYDTMGGARHLPRARHLSKAAALRSAPALRPDALVGAVRFHDAQEDDALFACYVARTAARHGAQIATRVRATGFVTGEDGRVAGAELRDELTGGTLRVRARHVIAAVGVGTDALLELATGRPHHVLRPSKGVHVIVRRSAIAMRTGLFMRTEKSIFHAIPWGTRHWLLGDTDTEWDGDRDAPVANRSDVEYILARVSSVLTRPVTAGDITGVFAGLRPLVAAEGAGDTTRLSRQHRLLCPRPGLTAIAGGKYTTYRVMARDAVDAAARDLGVDVPKSSSERVRLVGADPGGRAADGVDPALAELVRLRHGGCADEVFALAAADPALAAPIDAATGHLAAEAVHACTHQGALDLDDILSRRMRIAIEMADRGRTAAAAVAPLVAPHLGWDPDRAAAEVAGYVRLRDAEAAAEGAVDDRAAAAAYRAVLGDSYARAPGP
ncbi:MAG TPA: glycerol-3-phosphate dehydrogenase/oxidase [Gaiellales bacterium]|nr:glycerol-3-phosphate dehydrogenase/oxidase [Gaiellales bacterium]